MKLSPSILAVALLAALAAPAAHAEIAIDVIADSEVSFEGLVQADWNAFDNDVALLNGDAQDGRDTDQELRRAEIVLKGKGPGNFEWVVGYDAKADKYLDVNIKYKIGGNGNHYIQAGQFKQNNSMEELSSTKSNDFISKALITNTWAVARRVGVTGGYGDNNWGVAVGAFDRELTRGLAQGKGFGGRGYWAPINDKGSILHIGLSYVSYDAEIGVNNGLNIDNAYRFRTRPGADLAGTRLVDTGNVLNADRITTAGAEAFWVGGPVKLQGEFMKTEADRTQSVLPDFSGSGGYVSALWNVTGETWGYKSGVPTTPLPNEPESGMWQLGLRYDTIDLDDGGLRAGVTPTSAPIVDGILGGQMDTWTAGINWYWRSNFKFMMNYVKVDSSRYISTARRVVDDSPNILEARVQFYW
ncbi:MAG: OprO/OprP family phosphate-selective porin [Lysobacter sp.]|nr:OprO/OprP family phosphate-selective porin [Lysobacter sp.]